MFPSEPDPKGDPETWSREEMRRWLAAVGLGPGEALNTQANMRFKRNLFPQESDSREQLLERIRANMRISRQ
jgi:arsenate reductase-like glutaredoxin family protein